MSSLWYSVLLWDLFYIYICCSIHINIQVNGQTNFSLSLNLYKSSHLTYNPFYLSLSAQSWKVSLTFALSPTAPSGIDCQPDPTWLSFLALLSFTFHLLTFWLSTLQHSPLTLFCPFCYWCFYHWPISSYPCHSQHLCLLILIFVPLSCNRQIHSEHWFLYRPLPPPTTPSPPLIYSPLGSQLHALYSPTVSVGYHCINRVWHPPILMSDDLWPPPTDPDHPLSLPRSPAGFM